MNERHLFRGKYDSKNWVYGNLHICKQTNHHHIIGGDEADEHVEINLAVNNVAEVDPSTISQCTGLRDKNGKLIFEGDVIRAIGTNAESAPGIVEWLVGEDAFTYHCGFSVRWIERHPRRSHFAFWAKERQIEIIGNIHDNPELLND